MNPFGIKTEECNGNDAWTTGCTYRLPLTGCGGMSTFEQLKQSVEKAKAVLTAEARDRPNYFGAGFGSLPSVGMGMSMNLGGGTTSSSSVAGGVGSGVNVGTNNNRMNDMGGLIGDLSQHLNHHHHHNSSHLNHSSTLNHPHHHQSHHNSSSSSTNNSQHDRLHSSGEVSTSSSTPVDSHPLQNKRSSTNNNNNNNGKPFEN